MKSVILALFMVLGTLFAYAQDTLKTNVVKDKDGNYRPLTSIKTDAKLTGKYYIKKDGTKLPIYISKNDKLYVIEVSKKSGKCYNKYLIE